VPRGPKGEKRHADPLVVVPHNGARGAFLDRPGRREAAGMAISIGTGRPLHTFDFYGLGQFARLKGSVWQALKRQPSNCSQQRMLSGTRKGRTRRQRYSDKVPSVSVLPPFARLILFIVHLDLVSWGLALLTVASKSSVANTSCPKAKAPWTGLLDGATWGAGVALSKSLTPVTVLGFLWRVGFATAAGSRRQRQPAYPNFLNSTGFVGVCPVQAMRRSPIA